MRRIITLLAIFILGFYSCNKKKDNLIEKTSYKYVLAGVNTDMLYLDYSPDIIVKGTKVGRETDYLYNDSTSIDLNNDKINDIQINYYKIFQTFTCDPPLDCMPNADRKLTIKTLSGFEIACDSTTSSYYYSIYFPIGFRTNDTINKSKIWKSGKGLVLRHDNFSELNGDGFWYEKDDRYLGFRKIQDNDTIYGWLKISTKNDSIKIENCAVE